jgi:hypothetical protein
MRSEVKRAAMATHAIVAAVTALPCKAGEPPDLPSLSCTVVSQDYGTSLRLQIRFENQSSAAIELPPGPYLVLYGDREATDALPESAALARVQRTPLVVQPGASRVELFSVGSPFVAAHACEQTRPLAAGIYFYRFSQRPQFRCLLGQFNAEPLFVKSNCPSREPARSEPK